MRTRHSYPFAGFGSLAFLAVLIGQSLHAQTGQIGGVVMDEKGKPVRGAQVSASPARLGAGTTGGLAGMFPIQAKGLTDGNGQFEIDALADGDYRLCSELTNSTLLNSCQWADGDLVHTVKAGGKLAGAKLTMRQGVEIFVRVADPAGVFARHPEQDDVDVGVAYGRFGFIPGLPVARDKTGKTLRLVVLPAMQHKLMVHTTAANVEDAGHNLLAASSSVPVNSPPLSSPAPGAATSQAAAIATFTVTGTSGIRQHP